MTSTTPRHLEALPAGGDPVDPVARPATLAAASLPNPTMPTERAAGPRPPRLRRGLAALAAGIIATVVLAACGDDDTTASETIAADSEATDEAAAPAAADAESGDDEPQTIEVGLVDFAFEGLPDDVPAGTRLTVTNDADAELHELVAFRLPDGEDRPLAELLQLAQPELESVLGAPSAVLLAEPGGPMIPAVGDGMLDEPGRYALVCFIPTGVDPAAYLAAAEQSPAGPPQIDGAGPPHIVHGMHAELTVR